jgi:hypothetical protein
MIAITTKLKRWASKTRCRHSDNAFWWNNRINVRAGKRILRKKLKNMLNKMCDDFI